MDERLDRRTLLAGLGGGAAAVVAGCTSDDDDPTGSDGDDDSGSDDGDDDTTADEELDRTDDVVWAFGADETFVVAPDSGEILATVDEFDGADWGDARLTEDGETLYVVEGASAEVVAFDTTSGTVDDRIAIGPGPTHMYPAAGGELWAHADDEGTFYVIDPGSNEVVDRAVAGFGEAGHGKLVYSTDFDGRAYATNTNDAALHVMDLESRERVDSIEVGESGTHYAAYSPASGHVYVETTRGDETVVVDPETDDVVGTIDASGGLHVSPDGEYLSIVDGAEDAIHVVRTDDDEVVDTIEVPGGPDDVAYAERDGTLFGYTANTMNEQAAVVDFDELAVVDTLDVGEIHRPEDAHHLHRSGIVAGAYFVTPADGDDVVSVVSLEDHAVEQVDAPAVDTVAYVGEQ